MDPISGSAAAAAVAWLWDSFGDEVAESATDSAKSIWKRMNWRGLERTYRERMVALHTTTTLLGNPKRIDLSEIFTDVYVIDQVSAQHRLYEAATGREAIEHLDALVRQKRQPLLRMARTESRLFVLGKPGAGKSTFLKKNRT